MTINDAMKALAEALEPVEFWRGYGAVTGWKWGHVDFLRDEDASARLLDAMPKPLLNRNRDRFPEEQWACSEDIFKGICHYSADRKTAVFLAALAWKGIERPEELALRCSDKEGER